MPRVYKITTSKDALHLIQKGKSIRETAITSKIPYPTLRRYWKNFLLHENTIFMKQKIYPELLC